MPVAVRSLTRYLAPVLVGLSAACGTLVPTQETGVPITITNGDDEAASIEVTLYNAVTGRERTVAAPYELAPGDTTSVRIESTRGDDEAFHLVINGFVAVSSDFAGCDITDFDRPVPDSLDIVVLPNGEPDACSAWD